MMYLILYTGFCGLTSRLNKVKRSKEGGDSSRAIGKYFFFCSKKRDDDTQCRFARPVEMEMKKQKKIDKRMNSKADDNTKMAVKGGDDTKPVKDTKPMQICKFFAKNGSCKKGKKCEFSHEAQGKVTEKMAPSKAQEKVEVSEKAKDEEDDDKSSSSSSSSSDDSSSDSDEVGDDKKEGESKNEDMSSDSDDSSSSDSSDDDSD